MRDGRARRYLLRAVLVVLGSACGLLAVACGGSDQSSEVRGVAWRWSGLLRGEESTALSPIADPENYLLRLDEDGSFIARADCRSLTGTYSLSGGELTLDPGPTTKVACGGDSLSDTYVDLLGKVANYDVYEDGALALGLQDRAGYMYFYASEK
jgi:heat shock protein HslJ